MTIDIVDPLENSIRWPLKFSFKILTLSPKISVCDDSGRRLIHIKQKLFRLREHVELFSDTTCSKKLGEIHADKIIDWSACYSFSDSAGNAIGSLGRKGWRSIWRASYEVFNPGDDKSDFHIKEENPMAKVLDSLVGEIPIIGLITTFLFHPRYLAVRESTQEPIFRFEKKPAIWQRKFELTKLGNASSRETLNLILSFIMIALLERNRG
jgi:hypothetical protein